MGERSPTLVHYDISTSEFQFQIKHGFYCQHRNFIRYQLKHDQNILNYDLNIFELYIKKITP